MDSGDGRKLERFDETLLVRPEPQAMWRPSNPAAWENVAARFEGSDEDDGRGRWSGGAPTIAVPLSERGGPVALCRVGGNHHVGLFPEQRPHWTFAVDTLDGRRDAEVLNVFGYTGAASLLLAAAGARVTHVDASKKAVAWGRENQTASDMDEAPIRWICDDARKFLAREVRRGRRYHGLLLDPPKFGRGPKNEVWNLFDDLPALMDDAATLLADDAAFLILTAYAIRASALSIARLCEERLPSGVVRAGELAAREVSGRLLPTSMFAVWTPHPS